MERIPLGHKNSNTFKYQISTNAYHTCLRNGLIVYEIMDGDKPIGSQEFQYFQILKRDGRYHTCLHNGLIACILKYILQIITVK